MRYFIYLLFSSLFVNMFCCPSLSWLRICPLWWNRFSLQGCAITNSWSFACVWVSTLPCPFCFVGSDVRWFWSMETFKPLVHLQISIPVRFMSVNVIGCQTVLRVSMRPLDVTFVRKLSCLLEVNGKRHVFTQKRYIY